MGLWYLSLAINPVQTALERWFQGLADRYPALSWMVAHPVLAVICLLVLLAIIQILLGWISGGIKHLLFSIIKSPYSLVKWLLGKTTAPFSGSAKTPLSNRSRTQDQVTAILKRLDHCQREQDQLLLELKSLLPLTLPASDSTDKTLDSPSENSGTKTS